MDEKIDKAIENLLAMIRPNIKADDAQKFSQAAHNLAHVKSAYYAIYLEGKPKKQGAGTASA
jgi:hypothetical protein